MKTPTQKDDNKARDFPCALSVVKFRDLIFPVFRSFLPSSVSGHRRCTVSGFDCLLGYKRQLRSAGEVRIWGRMMWVGGGWSRCSGCAGEGRAAAVRPGHAHPAPPPPAGCCPDIWTASELISAVRAFPTSLLAPEPVQGQVHSYEPTPQSGSPGSQPLPSPGPTLTYCSLKHPPAPTALGYGPPTPPW